MHNLVVTSVFNNHETIPVKYTCDGEDVNPPLSISGIPASAKSLAIIIDDPDAPGKIWVHWVVWNISVTNRIKENTVPGKEGLNDFKRNAYGGPCPPSGVHRYFFKVYALDKELNLTEETTKHQLEAAMKGHIVASGELIGLYSR